ncbi:MAG: LysM peptidoglycan-binding domain-containing protein [Chitinophagales bacterium]|nr:LysM peptidoglycan-binding domain-containing protein [Chitinophagales bacterium]
MKLLIAFIFISISLLSSNLFAQSYDEQVEAYINQYKEVAIEEMAHFGIPASITLAQGIIESGAGQSQLATVANNHFGIKCHDWKGESFTYDDDKKNECFRKYCNASESFDDHSDFLKTRQRYAVLFTYDSDNYKAWAKGLKSCGYATNPQYANILIKCIEDFDLHQWDLSDKERSKWFAKINKSKEETPDDSQTETADKENKIVLPAETKFPNQRVFVFNDIKCVTMQQDESANELASKFEIGINRLMRYNDISETSQLKAGDRVYLQPKRHNGNEKFHTVTDGETMFNISRDQGIQLRELYEKNLMIIGTEPATGEVIYLRETRDTVPILAEQTSGDVKLVDVKSVSEKQIHTIEKGDTLYGISKKYNVTVEELKKLNHLSSNDLHVGDKILVSK